MWLDNLKELKQRSGLSSKQIAEKAGLSERTVSRVFSGDAPTLYVDTLSRIGAALGVDLIDILGDTKAVVGTQNLADLSEKVDSTTAELELLRAENKVMADKIAALTAENDLLRLKLEHKDELLALHNYYIKRGGN